MVSHKAEGLGSQKTVVGALNVNLFIDLIAEPCEHINHLKEYGPPIDTGHHFLFLAVMPWAPQTLFLAPQTQELLLLPI